MTGEHDAIIAIDPVQEPVAFMHAFLRHVREDHGLAVDNRTPWNKVISLHTEEHKT